MIGKEEIKEQEDFSILEVLRMINSKEKECLDQRKIVMFIKVSLTKEDRVVK
jgi:hypothetical protein